MRKIAMFDKVMEAIGLVSLCFVALCLYFLFFSLNISSYDISLAIILFLLCIIFSLTYLLCYYWLAIEDKTDCDLCAEKVQLNNELQKITSETKNLNQAHKILLNKQNELNEREDCIAEQENAVRMILDSKNPFDYVAHLRAHALEHLNNYVGKNVEELAELFKYQYKFEYLLSIYPELRAYRNDDTYIKYKEEEDKRCCIKNWLTEQEYNRLSEVSREQLAVNRYISNCLKWTDWEKGRNYEIYCAYILYNEGYDIVQEGLNKKLEDKGRDIIAVHRQTRKTLIVQCKNWVGPVRENIVFQLFGSYAQWLVDNGRRLWDVMVEPCLYITGPISDEAKRCAEMLDVQIRHLPMGKFPTIKCNVNHNTGQKIYHLPFDRHYDLVKINEKGKGYKFSIAEAVNEGFRRAYNH